MKSEILEGTDAETAETWIELLETWTQRKWELKYNSTQHGYSPKAFHQHCNGYGPTLVLVRDEGGWVFGGYTEFVWEGTGGSFKMDPETFIFTLSNPGNFPPTLFPAKPDVPTIYDRHSYGPTFGGGHDLCIHDANGNSFSNFGQFGSFSNPLGPEFTRDQFTGSCKFKVDILEVFIDAETRNCHCAHPSYNSW
jgi:hypothetical protein